MSSVIDWSPGAANGRPLRDTRPGSTALAMASLDDPLYRIADGVYMSKGTTNSYLVTTPEGDVVISTGLVVEGPIHRAKFDRVSTAPVRYIVLTQAHLDIVGGFAAFKGQGTEIVAHRNTHACQEDDERIKGFRQLRNPRFFPQQMSELSAADKEAMARGMAEAHCKAEPTILVEDRLDLTLGGRCISIIALPGGETIDSLMVHLPDQGILFTGNALGPLFPHMPNLHTIRGDRPRAALPYIETYERILALQPELLVTGHFEPVAGQALIREELGRLRDAVRYVHDETVKGMNAGHDVYALMRDIRLPDDLEVGEDYGTVPWAIQAIWHGYAGWFYFKSTTELYPKPVRDVYSELGRLAGPGPLADRAQVLLGEGKPLEAIHLAEVALAAEPAHRRSLETYLAAHRMLLAESPPGNRWFLYWLAGEIADAERRLAAS
ncbi:MAG TPA: MBL fold metallo-hydrolase [Alphaproteobacteria bacterium]|nr:MBL fold metallo-hydrolase [Alphaproteobacteria bacterium]